jgi:D-arabinose 1-dehydrogenase-like Zn-dependent alcohol dehydrogenase
VLSRQRYSSSTAPAVSISVLPSAVWRCDTPFTGVGAVASQIARVVLDLPAVITTASRSETVEFSKSMGATHVINHHEDLERQIAELKLEVPLKCV